MKPAELFTGYVEKLAQLPSAGCAILGLEITDDAKPVQSQPFQGNTAFMVGNEVGCNSAFRLQSPVHR